MDVGGRGPTGKTTHRTILSSALPRFRTPDLSVMEVLVLSGKKLAFKFSTYIFEYRLLPPYVHLASTHVMNAPRPSPCFCRPSALMYYCERKRKVKRGRPGTEAIPLPLLLVTSGVWQYSMWRALSYML